MTKTIDNSFIQNTFIVTIMIIIMFIIARASTFLASTLNCSVHRLFSTSLLAKHIVLFCSMLVYIYGFKLLPKDILPILIIPFCIIAYLCFLLVNRVDVHFFLVGISILICVYLINVNKQYLESIIDENKKNPKNNIKLFNNYITLTNNVPNINKITLCIKYMHYLQIILSIISIIILFMGFIKYFQKQYKDHSANFSYMTFIFGTIKCDYLVQSAKK